MKEIRLTRDYLKNPLNSVIILLCIVGLIEAVGWSIGYTIKLEQVQRAGGVVHYMSRLLGGLFLPELASLFIIISLLNYSHKWLHLQAVPNNWRAIGRYELAVLPILIFAFWVFSPVTQTVRYLTDRPPSYSFTVYWQYYLAKVFTWSLYFTYLFPVILVGYLALNISLLKDYLMQRRVAQEAAEAEAAEASQKALALSATFLPKPVVPSIYLSYLKGKNAMGELDFPVNDVYYFTIEDRFYYAELAKGRYMVGKTLNDLETELDPSQFFRIKRDYIVNRQAVLNYAYWENGKYIVRLNTPIPHEIIVPRARMHEFREWLQNADSSPLEVTS